MTPQSGRWFELLLAAIVCAAAAAPLSAQQDAPPRPDPAPQNTSRPAPSANAGPPQFVDARDLFGPDGGTGSAAPVSTPAPSTLPPTPPSSLPDAAPAPPSSLPNAGPAPPPSGDRETFRPYANPASPAGETFHPYTPYTPSRPATDAVRPAAPAAATHAVTRPAPQPQPPPAAEPELDMADSTAIAPLVHPRRATPLSRQSAPPRALQPALQPASPNALQPPARENTVRANAAPVYTLDPAGDPSPRVGRLSVLQGDASFEPAGVNEFTPAELNFPVTTGDRLYAGDRAHAEIEAGGVDFRLGARTDLSVATLSATVTRVGLSAGSLHLRTFTLGTAESTLGTGESPSETVELDTPNAALTVLEPGDLRVDADPATHATVLTVYSGQVRVNGPGFNQVLRQGASVRLQGASPLTAAGIDLPPADSLDAFSRDRDDEIASADSQQADFVEPGTVGADVLAQYGDWARDPQLGEVWIPRDVAADWQPYRDGRWTFVRPWGWTWVPAEPWGYTPAHYGRWARAQGRWAWVSGPRGVPPVWAPALVVFTGGDQFAAAIGYRGGVAAWFPLGPGETYTPPFPVSARFVNRVNAANLGSNDPHTLGAAYRESTLNAAFAKGLEGRLAYAFHDDTVVVPEAVLAAGRPVAPNAVRVSRADLASAEALLRPAIKPLREALVPAPAHTLPRTPGQTLVEAPPPAAAVNEAASLPPAQPDPAAQPQPAFQPPPPAAFQPPPAAAFQPQPQPAFQPQPAPVYRQQRPRQPQQPLPVEPAVRQSPPARDTPAQPEQQFPPDHEWRPNQPPLTAPPEEQE